MSTRVVIADDESLGRIALRDALSAVADVEIVAECANGRELVEAVLEHRPDAVFIDIEMPGLTGLEAARQLEARPLVVFVTAHDEYAVEAFGIEAVDYILKPVENARVAEAVGRVRHRLAVKPRFQAESFEQRFIVGAHGKLIVVETKHVEALEAEGNYVRLHTPKLRPLMRATLRSLEERLDGRIFVRIHRSFLVNINAVRELRVLPTGDYDVLLRSGATVSMSRTYRDALLERLKG